MSDPIEPSLTVKAAARVLAIHINTLKRIPTEELPFFRVGPRGDRRYRPEALRAYMNRHADG